MMRIVTLLENNAIDPGLKARHGIALYIETDDTKILFDAGPDDSLLKNAERLGVDLAAVDVAILSHGHLDHGGGLAAFMSVNRKAKVILKDSAVKGFYAKLFWFLKIDIGLKLSALERSRLQFISGNHRISDRIQVITGFEKSGFIPSGNASLFISNQSGRLVVDPFDHEICLLIQSGDKQVLLTGCAHSGLGNMIRTVQQSTNVKTIDVVLGGFHLFNPVSKKTEPEANIDRLIVELDGLKQTVFYTGHCTGEKAFRYLKSKMGDRIKAFHTGTVITI
jgi:7,8-dihydropterin-6-yl-methyl-4-(beta-D-ribofuranosyl)aminobenzene 5'-phosphate synthase